MSIPLQILGLVAGASLSLQAVAQEVASTTSGQLTGPDELYTIQGVGAASGLIHDNGQLYIISDNSNYLYQYHIGRQTLQPTLVLNHKINEQVPKKQKADFEAITTIDKTLYLFGSGSSKKRETLVKYHPDVQTSEKINLHRVYQRLRRQFAIGKDDFNIEGALTTGGHLLLFNRGNGPSAKNGVFVLEQSDFVPKSFHEVPLGRLNGVPLGFTDALLVDGKIYFIAAAEGVGSTYHDGEIQGTVFGYLNPETMQVEYTKTISTTHKFEGLALSKKEDDQTVFLLCEDPDDGGNYSVIYQLMLTP